MRRFREEYRVRQTIAILQAFPQILRLDPNQDYRLFENECSRVFSTNEHALRRITSLPHDEYIAQQSDLWRDIIRSRTPLTVPGITTLLARGRAENDRRRREELSAANNDNDDDSQDEDNYGMYGRRP